MDQDKYGLVEKILKDLDNVMSRNAELCDFDIVPVDTNFRNKSPVLYIENCLGLESWCVKYVYKYCYSEIMDRCFTKPRRNPHKIKSIDCDRLSRLLNITLLLNPDLTSLWNKRREMVLQTFLDVLSELKFSKLVLSRKPKCNEAFTYRRWLLEYILKEDGLQMSYIDHLVTEELHICNLASDKSPNNYHSWNHRMWLITKLKTVYKQADLYFLYVKEYDFSERWTSQHISDFSCFHYRQFCIHNVFCVDNANWAKLSNDINLRQRLITILVSSFPNDATIQVSEQELLSYKEDSLIDLLISYNNSKNCKCIDKTIVCKKLEVLCNELVLNNEFQRFYKNHETLWYHRRYIIHELLLVIYNYFGFIRQSGALVKSLCRKCNTEELKQKQPKIVKYDCSSIYSCVLFKVLLSHEKQFIDDRQKDGDNHALRHEKYLRFVEGLNSVM